MKRRVYWFSPQYHLYVNVTFPLLAPTPTMYSDIFICFHIEFASLFINRNINEQVSFQVADALNQPFPDGQFDLVWSMESGEHMPNKEKVHYV